jgi:hypothetical protein
MFEIYMEKSSEDPQEVAEIREHIELLRKKLLE